MEVPEGPKTKLGTDKGRSFHNCTEECNILAGSQQSFVFWHGVDCDEVKKKFLDRESATATLQGI